MKWIKASERLPEDKNKICIRWGSAEEWVYSSARPFKALEKLMLITPELEWLDESPSPDNQEELWAEVEANLDHHIQRSCGGCSLEISTAIEALKSKYTITKNSSPIN